MARKKTPGTDDATMSDASPLTIHEAPPHEEGTEDGGKGSSLLDKLSSLEIIETIKVGEGESTIAYTLTKPSFLKDSRYPTWTLRQYIEAGKLAAQLIPIVGGLMVMGEGGNEPSIYEVIAYLTVHSEDIIRALDEDTVYRLVATVYKCETEPYTKDYPIDKHMTALSGEDGAIIVGAIQSFLPHLGKSIASGASQTSGTTPG
jgi:hypothetical protein